jgi:AraC-like DNA-binding protein
VLRALKNDLTLSIEQSAKVVGLSVSRLEHIVRKDLGIDLRTWKRHRQMKKARQCLLDLNYPLKHVPDACGIRDRSNFYHAFKEYFGVTPGAYRRASLSPLKRRAAGFTNK